MSTVGGALLAQDFRQPVIPGVTAVPSTFVGELQQFGGSAVKDDRSSFVPDSGGDSLGLVPVRPRNSGAQDAAMYAPEYSGGRTERDRRLLNQIREGNFEDSVPGLDPVEEGPRTIRQRYPDGKVQLVRQVVQDREGNYINNGPWRLYNRRGELMARGQFANGFMDGTWERWHPASVGGMFASEPFTNFAGPFISNATFSKGKLDGVWVISDRNSRKILEVPYRNGKRHGPATWFYPNSERLRMVNFRQGLLDGPLMEWDEQNRVTRNDEYIQGQKVVRQTTFFAPKQKRSETYYLEGKLVLEGEDSWWDGEPAEYVLDGIRVQHGPTVAWHSNGQRKMAGQYRQDERVGTFVWWHENGTRALAGRYREGFKNGTWTWWHANGMKSIEGKYDDDVPVGEWKWWGEDGDVTQTDDFGVGVDSTANLPEPNSDESEVQSSDTTGRIDATGQSDDRSEMSKNPPAGEMLDGLEEIRPGSEPLSVDEDFPRSDADSHADQNGDSIQNGDSEQSGTVDESDTDGAGATGDDGVSGA